MSADAPAHPARRLIPQHTAEVTLAINGRKQQLALDLRTSPLDALREQMRLTG
jgi:hypothetical protein